MINVKNLIKEMCENLDFASDYMSFNGSSYVCDAKAELADFAVPCYNSYRLDWLNEDLNNVYYVNDAVSNFGVDVHNFDLFQIIGMGMYLQNEEYINEHEQELNFLVMLDALAKIDIEAITEEQKEALEDFAAEFDHNGTFDDLRIFAENLINGDSED